MDIRQAYDLYERAWNEPDNAPSLLADAWAADGIYADDDEPDGLVGAAALAEFIRASHEAMPGFRVWMTGQPRMLAGRMVVTWRAEGGDPPVPSAGTDVIEFDGDGRIARVTDALDLT
jgi:hypothetical protein